VNAISKSVGVCEVTREVLMPVPPAVPDEFAVRLGEGWGGSLHDLANGLINFELGMEAAVVNLLSWIRFVEYEIEGIEECQRLHENLRMLRGAVMTAGAANR
jgi:hypothetical protein